MKSPLARKIFVALILAASSVGPTGLVVPEAAMAAGSVTRQAGANRYATSVAISKATFAPGVSVAYISTGANFPDALAGGPLAAKSRGPVLLVEGGRIPDVTRSELTRLTPKRIVVLGGTGTVSSWVAASLGSYTTGTVTRLHGSDRYGTSVAISKAGFSSGVSAVYIATGENFPDALAASAAAARGGFPVLLVKPNSIPDAVRAELNRLKPGRVYIAGGPGVVSEQVRSALGVYTTGPVERVAGADRYATAAAISKKHFGTATGVYVATGENYPDALAAVPAAAIKSAPVLLTRPLSLPDTTRNELVRLKPRAAIIAGGTAVVSTYVAGTIAGLIGSSTGSSRCAHAMPSGASAGWTRRVTSTFSETTRLGAWPGPVAAAHWKNRAAGAKDSSGRGVYDSSRTVSEANGLLDIWIHSEVADKRGVHDPAGQRYVAAVVSKLGATRGARITICMRADVIPGYKLAYLLWPSEGPGNYHGEIDYPETRLSGLPATSHAFMHYAPEPTSGKFQDYYDSGVAIQQWRTYTIEWNPKAATPYAKFYLDGKLIGHSTKYVPTITMTYIMQNETALGSETLPPPAQGHVQIDWITIDLPS